MKAIQQFENIYGIKLTKSKHLEILALMLCLEVVLGFSYIGYIQLPLISVTTMHILVIVAAMYFGPWDAAAIAVIFGATSMWKASVTSLDEGDIIFSPALSGKPAQSIIMAVGARVAFAIIAGFIFRWFFSKKRKYSYVWIGVISIFITLIHSGLVYAGMAGFFGATEVETSSSFSRALILNNLLLYVITVVVVLFDYWIVSYSKSIDFLKKTTNEEFRPSKKSRSTILVYLLLIVCCLFIAMHLFSRLSWYIKSEGGLVDEAYLSYTYNLILQFIVGFGGVFGILAIAVAWIQEYYAALTLEANALAKKNAEISNESKTSFLFNMSHDIRTPMNAIIGFTDRAIRHRDDDEVLDESLAKVKSSSEYLLRIVNDILDMAKIESGKLEIHENLYVAEKGTNGFLDMLAADAARKDIMFNLDYDIKDNHLWLDRSRIDQIIANLVSNAIKYTNPGGEIWYSTKQVPCDREGYARIETSVKDTGVGMSPEFTAKVFESFERSEDAIKSGEQGTGLGMAIVKKLVDAMGGEIKVESELGKGTTVTFALEHRIATPEEIESLKSSDKAKKKEIDFTGKRLLVVEDNELNREIIVELLEEQGFVVETAVDGDIAVNMYKQLVDKKDYKYYTAILMDVQMPRMNGYDATKAIRDIPVPEDIHIPIIAMTANAFEEDKQKALDSGMDDHLAKPIDVNKLFETLAKYA